MSQRLISLSPDLLRLRDEGYNVSIVDGHLVIRDVPYVDGTKSVRIGALVSTLDLAGDVTAKPGTHVAMFIGGYPCDKEGGELGKIRHQSGRVPVGPNLVVDHSFSSKPPAGYADYHEKMTTYVAIISNPAQAITPTVTAQTFPVIEADGERDVFKYIDTSSSRSRIGDLGGKLASERVAIVGLGGTGAYVLDLMSKTPVRELHLFDGDKFLQHNAFRAPGAASVEELRSAPYKVEYYANVYSRFRHGVSPHRYRLEPGNVSELEGMAFVFVCVDHGPSRKVIIDYLIEHRVPFIDVGMGLFREGDALGGIVRVTAGTPGATAHITEGKRVSFGADEGGDEYRTNIQLADLNALNAALAVIKWKKQRGFYLDLERERHSLYTIDGNDMLNEDKE